MYYDALQKINCTCSFTQLIDRAFPGSTECANSDILENSTSLYANFYIGR